MKNNMLKNSINALILGTVALSTLSACTVDRPVANAIGTAAGVAALSVLFYNIGDGLYYDKDYKPMPRGYRPPQNARIERVNDIRQHRQERERQMRERQANFQQNRPFASR